MRRDAAGRAVQRQFANRDAHAVRAQVTQPQNPTPIRDDNCSDIFHRPVLHHGVHLPYIIGRKIHTSRSFKHVAELEASLPYCRRVDERREFANMSHNHSMK